MITNIVEAAQIIQEIYEDVPLSLQEDFHLALEDIFPGHVFIREEVLDGHADALGKIKALEQTLEQGAAREVTLEDGLLAVEASLEALRTNIQRSATSLSISKKDVDLYHVWMREIPPYLQKIIESIGVLHTKVWG